MLVGPYYVSTLLLSLFGKTFNWSFFIALMLLSIYMAYSYMLVSSKKLWAEQILKE